MTMKQNTSWSKLNDDVQNQRVKASSEEIQNHTKKKRKSRVSNSKTDRAEDTKIKAEFCRDPVKGSLSSTVGGADVLATSGKKMRGGYKCSKCGEPKRGHICPFANHAKKRFDGPPPETHDVAVQCEMDPNMVVSKLRIEQRLGFTYLFPKSNHTPKSNAKSRRGSNASSSFEENKCGREDVNLR